MNINGFSQDNRPRYAQIKSIEISSLSSATNSTNESKGKLVMSDGVGKAVWKLLSELPAESGVLPVANGGTGSTTQNFVDLSNSQTVAGAKTWSNLGTFSAGLTSVGKITTVASSTTTAGLTLPHGSAPTSPSNGDIWTTTSGLFAQINGTTVSFGSGGGTVTNFSAGDLSPLFTTSEATTTTTPALSFTLTNATAYSVFGNSSSSSGTPSYTTDPVTKTFGLAGSTSGIISIKSQAATGTYNFNLPISAGTSGQPLLSGGGGTTAMTFGTLGVGGGGTGLSSYTTGDLLYASATGTLAALPAVATGYVLSSNGTGVAPSWKTFDSAIGSSILPVANGGTGKSSVTSKALLLGNGTSALTEITKPTATSTQVLVASSTLDPSWGATVAMSGDVSIDNSGITTVSGILGKSISGTLDTGNILKYNGMNWIPSDPTAAYTFTNGLTSTSGTVKLGGTLTEATTITLGDKDILFNPFNTTTGSGNVIISKGDGGSFTVYSSVGGVAQAGGKFQILPSGAVYLDNSMDIERGLSVASSAGNLKIGNGTPLNLALDGNDLFVTDDAEIGGDCWVIGSFNGVSDERLKTNIETLSGVVDKINQMRGVRFLFKDQKKYSSGLQIGVIAQEVQKVFPELVHLGSNGFYGVDYPHLTAVLLQAVKEQQTQIGSLQDKLNEQETRIGDLQKQINEIKSLMQK